MATTINRLNVLKLPKLNAGMHADGGGLYYAVTPVTRKTLEGPQEYLGRSWIFKYSRTQVVSDTGGTPRTTRKSFKIGLGSAATVTLAQARTLAAEHNAALAQKLDPQTIVREKRSALRYAINTSITFKIASEQFIKAKKAEWSNPKHAAQWESTLRDYVIPILGEMDVKVVQTTDVRRVLEPIWLSKTETATRVRQRVEAILDWATALGYREGANPAKWRGHLEKLMPAPSKIAKVTHQASLPYQQTPELWAQLIKTDVISANCLRFIMLTGARSNEARSATWSEIDEKNSLWIIPSERMKARVEHRVPLSKQALALLESTPRVDGCDLLFPGQNLKTVLSDVAVSKQLHRHVAKGTATLHGMRSSFRMWAAEHGINDRAAEFCLAHSLPNKVEASYNRSTLLEQRKTIMQSWADYLVNNITAAGVTDIASKRSA